MWQTQGFLRTLPSHDPMSLCYDGPSPHCPMFLSCVYPPHDYYHDNYYHVVAWVVSVYTVPSTHHTIVQTGIFDETTSLQRSWEAMYQPNITWSAMRVGCDIISNMGINCACVGFSSFPLALPCRCHCLVGNTRTRRDSSEAPVAELTTHGWESASPGPNHVPTRSHNPTDGWGIARPVL